MLLRLFSLEWDWEWDYSSFCFGTGLCCSCPLSGSQSKHYEWQKLKPHDSELLKETQCALILHLFVLNLKRANNVFHSMMLFNKWSLIAEENLRHLLIPTTLVIKGNKDVDGSNVEQKLWCIWITGYQKICTDIEKYVPCSFPRFVYT